MDSGENMYKRIKIIRYFGDKKQEYSDILKNGYVTIYKSDECPHTLHISTNKIYFMEQTHSNNVVIIDDVLDNSYVNNHIPDCDAIITSQPEIFLCTRTADCFPILVYDEVKNIVSAVHSGRDSTKLKIIKHVINAFKERFDSKNEDIKILIGAGISPENYLVSEDMAKDYYNDYSDLSDYSCNLNLQKHIIDTALENGVPAENITASNICTYDDNDYFSFRKDNTTKRQISIIGMIYV